MQIPQYALSGQIATWLRALPTYAAIDTYVGKFPEAELEAFYDAIEISRLALVDDRQLAVMTFSLQEWELQVNEFDQYEQLQDLLSPASEQSQQLITTYPALSVSQSEEFKSWCKLYLNRWYVLSAFACSREYLVEMTYLSSLFQSITDPKDFSKLQEQIEGVLTQNAIQSASQNISPEQVGVERSLLTELKIFSKQSIEDFLDREIARYELFEKLFNVLSVLVASPGLTLEDTKEVLRRQLMTRSLRYLLGRSERERLRRQATYNKDIFPWLNASWSLPNLKSGKTLSIMNQYIDQLSNSQGAEFFPYIYMFIETSFVLDMLFEPVPALEVCNELKLVLNDPREFNAFTELVLASRVYYKDECLAALTVLRLIVQRFPGI